MTTPLFCAAKRKTAIEKQDLRDRLRTLGVKPLLRPAPVVDDGPAPFDDEPAILPAISVPTRQRPADLERLLPGAWHETPHGSGFVVEYRYDLSSNHGAVRLDTMLSLPADMLPRLGRNAELGGLDTRRLLFLDTETTGLAGGTGTYVFLIGLGFFEGEQFVVRQLFMPDLDSERAVLHLLNELVGAHDGLVSFNGRAFDWPLIEARFTMSRLRARSDMPHLDLLSPARRVWKDHLPSCSLGSLEAEVIRFKRRGDVPGWLIPTLYFQYLRSGSLNPLLPVFEHNKFDVLSMLALAGHLGRMMQAPEEADLQSAEYYGLGRLHEDLGEYALSVRLYERALRVAITPAIRALALQHLTTLYRRLDQRHEAIRICEDLTAGGTTLLFPYVELAKHYEHAARDCAAAEALVQKALEVCRNPWNLIGQPANTRPELERRLRRLREKQERQAAIAARPRPQPRARKEPVAE